MAEPTAESKPDSKSLKPASTIISVNLEEPDWLTCKQCKAEFGVLDDSGVCHGCAHKNRETARGLAEIREREEAYRAELVQKLGGLKAHDQFKLDGFLVDANTAEAFNAVKNFDPEKENLFLYGPRGVGKTHLAVAVARRYITVRTVEAEFWKVHALLRWFRMRNPREEDAAIQRLVALRVLVIDDLGLEKDSEFSLGVLYDIIDGRDMAKRNGLIITSNLAPKELAEKLGDDRITSRVFGMSRVIGLTGKDHRIVK